MTRFFAKGLSLDDSGLPSLAIITAYSVEADMMLMRVPNHTSPLAMPDREYLKALGPKAAALSQFRATKNSSITQHGIISRTRRSQPEPMHAWLPYHTVS
jgi:hypothetical protein